MKKYKLIFAGTPEFAAVALKALLQSEHQVVAVYTQPDRPAGRGRKLTASPVKEVALQHQLPVFQPETLKDPAEQNKIKELGADFMIVAAYGLLLPKAVLTAPNLGCLNIHASLLPRWRGAAPIQRAILAGDDKTGITIMQMDEGLDTGDMLYKAECKISNADTSQMLHDQLADMGAKALLHTLAHYSEIQPEKQNNELANYAKKITKEEASIDWNAPADELVRKVHAFNPWPVAFSNEMRIWDAIAIKQDAQQKPGHIVAASSAGIDVATGKGILRLLKLQFPGGKVLTAAEILNAKKDQFVIGKSLIHA